MNVALYSERGGRWAMTERRRGALSRTADQLTIGPSELRWDGEGLTIDFDEVTAPLPSRLRGKVRLKPSFLLGETYDLDGAGGHLWRPIAPRAEVEVSLASPGGAWRGSGYFDTNWGAEPVERGFTRWTWSRAHLPRETRVYYDVAQRSGEPASLALSVDALGRVQTCVPRDPVSLPTTAWRLPRLARPLGEAAPTVVRTLEDGPFYARSLLLDRCDGETAEIIHERLSGDRLRSPIVRAMLPFRMPRTLW